MLGEESDSASVSRSDSGVDDVLVPFAFKCVAELAEERRVETREKIGNVY